MRASIRLLVVSLTITTALLALVVFSGCDPSKPRTEADKGRTLYSLHCTACHNPDPSKDGSLGPALKGSGLDLLIARVTRGEYPPGYTPKRQTHIMQKLPLSEDEVKSLHAYLNSL